MFIALISLLIIALVIFKKELIRFADRFHLKYEWIIATLLVITLPIMAFEVGIMKFAINYLLILFCIWAFLYGFIVNRKYIYGLSLFFLVGAAVFSTARMNQISEYFGVLCYLLLVMGVFKDLLYEKIFNN